MMLSNVFRRQSNKAGSELDPACYGKSRLPACFESATHGRDALPGIGGPDTVIVMFCPCNPIYASTLATHLRMARRGGTAARTSVKSETPKRCRFAESRTTDNWPPNARRPAFARVNSAAKSSDNPPRSSMWTAAARAQPTVRYDHLEVTRSPF